LVILIGVNLVIQIRNHPKSLTQVHHGCFGEDDGPGLGFGRRGN
jgi:hypothetical protein